MLVSSAMIRPTGRSTAARVLRPYDLPTPANDDDHGPDDGVLDAALHHFAMHGLGAARAAGAQVEAHWSRGEREAAADWLAICRAFDKRLARDLETRLGNRASTSA
jgi:hypothetical protein